MATLPILPILSALRFMRFPSFVSTVAVVGTDAVRSAATRFHSNMEALQTETSDFHNLESLWLIVGATPGLHVLGRIAPCP
jgi:hypothetical protein